jgi:hypothetical protein
MFRAQDVWSANKIAIVTLLSMTTFMSCKSRSSALAPGELDGTWVSTCRSRTDQLGTNYFEINALSFSGGSMTSSVRSYSDATCKTELTDKPILVGVSTYSTGEFTLGTGGARKFTSQLETLTITLTTEPYVALYNGDSGTSPPVCGGGFILNQPKEMKQMNCTTTESLSKEFMARFDIFKVAGDLLYFGYLGVYGSDTDGSSDNKRPKALDPAFYTKI